MKNKTLSRLSVLLAIAFACGECLAVDSVALIIDSSLLSSPGVQHRVLRYKADVEGRFPVELRICGEAAFESYSPQQIRAYITDLYDDSGIDGVILAGQIQYRLWKNYAPGSNDWGINSFYYEDLDGTFTDTDGDGMDDYHTWGTNVGPEVWVCWMRPPANNPVNALNAFLNKAHRYYFGEIAFNHRALVAAHKDYDNNIWSGFRMVDRLRPLYGTEIDIDGDGADLVIAGEHLNALEQNRYEICDPMGHANAWLQAWDSGSVSSSAIRALTGGAIMTFIYGCRSAAFNDTASDGIAQAYVFGNGIGQACSGTSWSYGTEGKWYVYEEMERGGYLGRGWWNLETTKNTPAYMISRYGTWLDTNRHLWGDSLLGNPFVYANFVPTQPSALSEAVGLPDGAPVIFEDGITTANFGSEVYLERADRSCGIKAYCSSSIAHARRARVTGIMGSENGERVVRFAEITDLGAASAVKPVMMPGRALSGRAGSSGANNLALVVTVCGKINARGNGWFTIDDGSGLVDAAGNAGVKIDCAGLKAPNHGFAIVTGISATELSGTATYPVVRARTSSDIESF